MNCLLNVNFIAYLMLDYKLQYIVCKYTKYDKLSQQNTNLFAVTSTKPCKGVNDL